MAFCPACSGPLMPLTSTHTAGEPHSRHRLAA